MSNKPILIVPCELNSVFFEVFFKVLKRKNFKIPLILICSSQNLKQQTEKLKFKKKIRVIDINNINYKKIDNKRLNVINVNLSKENKKILNNENIKDYYERCFSKAFELLKMGFAKKFLNGPINKKKILDKKFNGITEFITDKFNQINTGMLIYNKKLSVSPLTTHLPLKLVSKNIKKNIIQKRLKLINSFYKENFNFNPRIAVTGLNPHCESNLKNNEDDTIIKPAIKKSKNNGIKVFGPFSADTIFLKQNRKHFDVVLGMYHDQVLSPIKILYEYDAINITMGLPFLRVSPDHGPNERMVDKNLSNPLSVMRAIEFLEKN